MDTEQDVKRWENYVREAKRNLEFYQSRINEFNGVKVKYTLKQKIRMIWEIITR